MSSLVVLGEAECRELLGSTGVGRVAVGTPQGPRIVPVNFTVRGEAIVFRTAAYAELATYARDAVVAFEADHLDHERERGWSVVAHGTCREVDDPELLRWVTQEWAPRPWAGGQRAVLFQIVWTELTGRRVGGDHWPHPITPR